MGACRKAVAEGSVMSDCGSVKFERGVEGREYGTWGYGMGRGGHWEMGLIREITGSPEVSRSSIHGKCLALACKEKLHKPHIYIYIYIYI